MTTLEGTTDAEIGTGGASVRASVIICAYTFDRWDVMVQAIRAVRGQTGPPAEIILVIDDNAALLESARRELAGVVVTANEFGGGLSGGRVTGARLASAPLLAFLDDDAVPEPDWLDELLRPYDDPLVLGTGGRVDPWWETRRPAWLAPEMDWIVGCTYKGMATHGGRIRNPIGANMSIRKDVMLQLETFAPALGRTNRGRRVSGTADETEFSIRAASEFPGSYWVYAPEAKVRHFVPASRGTITYFVRRCRLEGTAKATLTSLVGSSGSLASERTYASRILPSAILRDVLAGVLGEPTRLVRAVVTTCGALLTAGTYAVGRVALSEPWSGRVADTP